MFKFVEIYGLKANGNGRSCQSHVVCGETVGVGSLLLLKPVVIINSNNQNEYAIAALLMVNDVESCTIGFIGREFHHFRTQYENKLVEVVEILADSKNTEHRRRSHANKGIAVCLLIN